MRRSSAREFLMQMLFEMSIQNDFGEAIRDRYVEEKEIPKEQQEYFSEVYAAVRNNLEKIDQIIDSSMRSWSLETLAKVDLAILRLAIAEILYMDSIPLSVSINEAVELGKKFGGDNSARFVNGILGAVAREKNE